MSIFAPANKIDISDNRDFRDIRDVSSCFAKDFII